jgi:hypothetical protein
LEELEKLEKKISNPNRYFEYDFQLVEDALQVAILSRMLENPRDEVEGKFDRAIRLCKKLDISKQWIRLYYQRAWTYYNWYDDFSLFIDDYNNFKKYFSKTSDITDVGLYFNLFNLLQTLSFIPEFDLTDHKINIENERIEIFKILSEIEANEQKPNSALRAKTYKSLIELTICIYKKENPINYLKKLSEIILDSSSFIDYPFESVRQMIEVFGVILPNEIEYDTLIDNLAAVSEKRHSELASGELFIKRAAQKLQAKYYKESVIYFGKAVMKLAKEDSKDGMCLVLLGLGMAYRELGLIWASNNCYISVCFFSFRSISEGGNLYERVFQSLKEIIQNELLIGRLPSILAWYEMFYILSHKRIDEHENEDEIPFPLLIDGCVSARLLNISNTSELQYLPDIFEKLELDLTHDTVLYKLGHFDKLMIEANKLKTEQDLDDFFKLVANQPFIEQTLYPTSFFSENELCLSSTILGCRILVKFPNNLELLLVAETLLAFTEGFFATLMGQFIAYKESITINIQGNVNTQDLNFSYNELNEEYNILIKNFQSVLSKTNPTQESLLKFVIDLLMKCFIANDTINRIENLFKKEEIHERLSLILNHRNFTINILGEKSKLFFNEWLEYIKPKEYNNIRKTPILNLQSVKEENKKIQEKDIIDERHDSIKAHSIIDIPLWDKAQWNGFGYLFHPQNGLAILLAYADIDAATKIFDQWINRFGTEDKLDLIRITIIKGVDKGNPYWYRVHISANIKIENSQQSSKFFTIVSRIHEMNAENPANLNNLVDFFKTMKKYTLFPARFSFQGNKIEPVFNKGILKTNLIVKDAWEIGENDLDRAVIKSGDNPIIPDSVKEAPILKILLKK